MEPQSKFSPRKSARLLNLVKKYKITGYKQDSRLTRLSNSNNSELIHSLGDNMEGKNNFYEAVGQVSPPKEEKPYEEEPVDICVN